MALGFLVAAYPNISIHNLRIGLEKKWKLRILSVSVFLILWEILGQDQFLIAAPSAIAWTFVDQLVLNPVLAEALAKAMVHGAAGFVLSLAIGIPLGFLIGFWRPARNVLNPLIDALYVTPLVALIPLIIIWFGLTVTAKIVFVFLICFLDVVINTETGVRETPEGLVDAAQVFGASERRIYTEVHLRHALPYLMNGARLSGGRAVRGIIIAELFVTAGDLGNYFADASSLFRIPELYTAILALTLLGVIVVRSIDAVERRLLHYRDL